MDKITKTPNEPSKEKEPLPQVWFTAVSIIMLIFAVLMYTSPSHDVHGAVTDILLAIMVFFSPLTTKKNVLPVYRNAYRIYILFILLYVLWDFLRFG